jgi:anti-anti-sigma factor
MIEIAPGWSLEVERGPDWLCVTLDCLPDSQWENPPLADRLWSILQQNFTYRLVLDCSHLEVLHTWLIGQLVQLQKRISSVDGRLRLYGLSDRNQQVLTACRLDHCFPQYHDRAEAVAGAIPAKPR